jgi:hypothetical protein
MYKIRTYNQIAVKGLERFPRDQFEVSSESADPTPSCCAATSSPRLT